MDDKLRKIRRCIEDVLGEKPNMNGDVYLTGLLAGEVMMAEKIREILDDE